MSIFNLRRFVYNIQRFNECFLQQKFVPFITIGDNTSTTINLKSNYFNLKVMRHMYNSFMNLRFVNSLLI